MNKKDKTELQIKFTRKMRKKLAVLFFIIMLALIGLSARLIYIYKYKGEVYSKQVLSQQEYDSRTIPYRRGDIVDANGTRLAISEKVYNVIIDAKVMNTKEEYKEPTIKALVDCFGADENQIRQHLTESPSSQYYILMKKLSYDTISPFLALQEDKKNNPYIKGVWFEEEYIRKYPYSTLACDVLGFTLGENTGYFGLEEYYNDTLNGIDGREYGYLNEDAAFERTIKEPTDGNTIITSLDANVQSIVEEKILEFNESHRDEAREGAGSVNTGVIIANPNTGEIIAMASYPVFDLNNPRDLTPFYTQEQIDALTEEQKLEELNKLWKNYCITETFEPGSPIKPFTVATDLETGKLTGNETFYCDGGEMYGGKKIKCVNRLGHGEETISQAISNSCNDVLMQISRLIGVETFTKFQKIFNFGLKTGIDLQGEVNAANLIYTAENMGPTDLATNAFGQNFNVTMIQMVAAFSSLVNGGKYYEPHLVSRIVSPEGGTVSNIEPKLLKETISKETADTIKTYLSDVIVNGTGGKARPAGYTMGGKTGTAETYPRGNGNYVVSFIGCVPADDPQVVIYVVVDQPNVADQAHSTYAMELTRNILTDVLPYLNIFQTEELTEEEIQELAEQDAAAQEPDEASETEGNQETQANEGADTAGEEGQNGETQSAEGEGTGQTEQDNVTIDEATGYAIDPDTGEYLDPVTGEPIDSHSSVFPEDEQE